MTTLDEAVQGAIQRRKEQEKQVIESFRLKLLAWLGSELFDLLDFSFPSGSIAYATFTYKGVQCTLDCAAMRQWRVGTTPGSDMVVTSPDDLLRALPTIVASAAHATQAKAKSSKK